MNHKSNFFLYFFYVFAGAVFNAGLSFINDKIGTPLFFDSIATIYITWFYGFFPGFLTALLTHVLMEVFNGFAGFHIPWVVCSLSSVVITHYFKKTIYLKSYSDYVLFVLLLASANSFLGSAISYLYRETGTHHPIDYFAGTLMSLGRSFFTSGFLSRLLINIFDKGVVATVIFLIIKSKNRKKTFD